MSQPTASGMGETPCYIRFKLTAIDTVQVWSDSYPEQLDDTSNVPFTLRRSPFFYKLEGQERVFLKLRSVPEIRVWGSTELGQRCCVHVHGFLPYVYLEYKGSLDPDEVQRYIFALGKALNLAMFYSFRGRSPNTKYDSAKDQAVGFITLCKGIPFYGFHVGHRYFLKIHGLQPKYMRRLSELLKSGAVLPKFKPRPGFDDDAPGVAAGCQIFEAHIPFLLQFMLDFNLYGCNWIELAKCTFRAPLPEEENLPSSLVSDSSNSTKKFYTTQTVPPAMVFEEEWLYRISPEGSKTLEFDVHVADILNRHSVQPRNLHHDFTEFLRHPVPDDFKLVHSVKGVWEDERQRRLARGESGPSEESPPSYQRKYQPGEQPKWSSSDRFNAIFQTMLQDDKKRYLASHHGSWPPTFESFVKPEPLESFVPTTFESVESLFPSTFVNDEEKSNPFGAWAVCGMGVSMRAKTEDVDEHAIARLATQIKTEGDEWGEEGEAMDNEEALRKLLDEDLRRAQTDDLSDVEDGDDQVVQEEALDEKLREGRDTMDASDGLEDIPPFPSSFSSSPNGAEATGPMGRLREEELEPLGPEDDDPDAAYLKSDDYGLGSLGNINFNTSSMLNSSPGTIKKDLAAPQKRSSRSQLNLFSSPIKRRLKQSFRSHSVPAAIFDVTSPPPAKRVKLSLQRSSSNSTRFVTTDSDFDRALIDMVTPEAIDSSAEEPPSPTQAAQAQSPLPRHPESFHRTEAGASSEFTASRRFEFKLASQDNLQASLHSSAAADVTRSSTVVKFDLLPPSTEEIVSTLWAFKSGNADLGLPYKRYQDPFYSNLKDVPPRKTEFAGSAFELQGKGLKWLRDFPSEFQPRSIPAVRARGLRPAFRDVIRWQYAYQPPTKRETTQWLATNPGAAAKKRSKYMQSQVDVASQANPFGFKFTQIRSSSPTTEAEHMTVLSMELHAASRGTLLPDPKEDAILTLFYCLHSESLNEDEQTEGCKPGCLVGCIALARLDESGHDDGSRWGKRLGLSNYKWNVVETEVELIELFVKLVNAWDPEILCGYEIQNSSWGYLLERSTHLEGMHLIRDLSRVTEQSTGRNERSDSWGYTKTSTIKITGRHVLPIWRVLRGEVNLTSYSFESCVYQVLRRRKPYFSPKTLNKWLSDEAVHHTVQVFRYWLDRVELDVELLDEAEIVSHTAEFARIYGVDFASVLNRGSQFKVESVLFRICKPESFVLLSPSRQEVGRQNALEAMPLIAEPKSAFYKDPLCVMDFQSLYPSVMIGYNYCYSTCLGRVGTFKGTNKLGVIILDLPAGLLSLLQEHVNISPNGLIFVKQTVRRSTLAKMLSELLSTRVMVKSSMKRIKKDKALTRIYNARQLGLKLLANVTYGYTSASFSGRMPCAEIADAIVQTGRESLERARNVIQSKPDVWGARVVYGDTDSLFVWLPGKTRDQAHAIGEDISEKVSMLNPEPIKLKFEKVYLPCVLASKKRYIGFKYEHKTEKEPVFDAKGIETVRRDGFPALQKMVEAAIRILFTTQDLSLVKEYCEAQWGKFYTGQVSPQDFIFAKEVKLGKYSINGIPPPGAVLADERLKIDARDEVQYGERVPYIVPESLGDQRRLVDRAVSPLDFLKHQYRLDARYHIKHTINALNRIFTLLGVDVGTWHAKMPKVFKVTKAQAAAMASQAVPPPKVRHRPETRQGRNSPNKPIATKVTLDSYYKSDRCIGCGRDDQSTLQSGLCADCETNPQAASFAILSASHATTARRNDVHRICASCANTPHLDAQECESVDCPMLYSRMRSRSEVAEAQQSEEALDAVMTPQRLKMLAASM